MVRRKPSSQSVQHECHQCMAPPERSHSGRRLSLPMSLLQAPNVPGPTLGSPSFGAVTRVRVVDQPFVEEPEQADSDQFTPTSPNIRPRAAPDGQPGRASSQFSFPYASASQARSPSIAQSPQMARSPSIAQSPQMTQVPGSQITGAQLASQRSPSLAPLPPPILDPPPPPQAPPGGPAYTSSISSSGPLEKRHSSRERERDPELGELGLVNEYEPCTFHRWAMEDVASLALVPTLVTQALSAGVLDATTYADFMTFASNQTGNAIVLTLSAVGTIRQLALLTGVSFAGFIGGAFIFGHLGNFFGHRRRIWLLFSTLWQCLLLVITAVFVSPAGPRSTQVGATNQWSVLFLFAHMSGIQVAMARQSSCAELPGAPMTSAFVDFVADQYLFRSWSNPKAQSRNRRLMYMIAMIGGSFLGAILHRWTASWIVIMVTILLKALSGVLICFASPEN